MVWEAAVADGGVTAPQAPRPKPGQAQGHSRLSSTATQHTGIPTHQTPATSLRNCSCSITPHRIRCTAAPGAACCLLPAVLLLLCCFLQAICSFLPLQSRCRSRLVSCSWRRLGGEAVQSLGFTTAQLKAQVGLCLCVCVCGGGVECCGRWQSGGSRGQGGCKYKVKRVG